MTGVNIVHFGPGAFHRAHQADYIDRLAQGRPDTGIAAVAMRSAATIEALKRQRGRYTLVIRDSDPSFRTLSAHKAFFGPSQGSPVRALLADPAVTAVTSTVTEKGYCLGPDGTLDFGHADVAHDLESPDHPLSIVGWLALAFRDRRASGKAPFVTLCCDNMTSNGQKLGAAVSAFAHRFDPDLARWIEGEARFPDTMVDSITPATDEQLVSLVREQGFNDSIPVARERYSAWIIEDILPAGAPDFASAGAVLASDVQAWEQAKLRILNGAHSTLAYLGLLLGHDTVASAMDDPDLAAFVEAMIRRDVVATLEPSPIDLQSYVGQILARFRNKAIAHRLSQIAWDGSQKLPYRLLDTIEDALAAGTPVSRLAVPIAAWILFVQRQARAGERIVDPLEAQLVERAVGQDGPERLLAMSQIFPSRLAENPAFRSSVLAAVAALEGEDPRPHLSAQGAPHG